MSTRAARTAVQTSPALGARGRWLASCALTALALLAIAAAAGAQEEAFPHDRHARLFPLCAGCHEGVPSGDEASSFPDPSLCARCHDGVQADTVRWTPPPRRSELRFTHPAHIQAVAREDTVLACEDCHERPGAEPMVGVFRASQDTCASCHAHATPDHYVTGACAGCHVPLAETVWSADRIASIAEPADHEPPDPFLAASHGTASHDEIERCATCHTRDRCTACHVDASRVAEIQALPVAPASLSLPAAGARYPRPASHTDPAFLEGHAPADASECATCHVREDCASCHLDVRVPPFLALFSAADVTAPGVGIVASAPASHDSPFFMSDHPALASTAAGLCASCHTRPFCADCHDDARSPVFHDRDYVQRHAATAYGQDMECANCHSVEVFCRACHVESGLGSSGRLTVGYHDAEPVWLLRHGQAARQSIESCQSCHKQRECLQCHSQTGSFQVSPHGPDFDARRAQERNPAICFACHVADPVNPGR